MSEESNNILINITSLSNIRSKYILKHIFKNLQQNKLLQIIIQK